MLQYLMLDKSCKNILVRGVNWIGDGIMILPALSVLRKAIPDAKISLLVKPWVSPLFENNPNIDEIIIYSDEYNSLIGKIRLSRILNRKNFCTAILLQNAFDAALITFLARIKERIGYKRDGRGFMLTTPIPLKKKDKKIHHIYYYLNLLEKIGLKPEYTSPYLFLSLDERLTARKKLNNLRRPLLGINPGATYGSSKRWLPERFAEIAYWFMKDTNGSVIIFGNKDEVDIAEEIEFFVNRQKLIKSIINSYKPLMTNDKCLMTNDQSLINLAGKTTLRELIALISECDVFLTNDSGPMHIAYAVKTPLVSIFGSTDPYLTGPPPDTDDYRNIILKPDVPCSPCFERTCKKNNMECMYAITSDEVYLSIKKILSETPAVFFDRDGTLCKDVGYLNNLQDFDVFDDIHILHHLKEKGFKLIGITNQSGIAKGIIDEALVKEINNIFIKQYGFNDFYYCPHHPDDHCPCRKPETDLLLRARSKYGIDFKKSYVVGDKETDMILAKMVGAKGILVQTGKDKESEYADFTAKNLKEAVEFIIKDKG